MQFLGKGDDELVVFEGYSISRSQESIVCPVRGKGNGSLEGIPIGKVISVGEEDVNIYKTIEVQPFVEVRSLEEVMVLTNAPQSGDIQPRQLPTGIQPGSGSR